MPQRLNSLRLAGLTLTIALAGFSFSQSFAPVDLSEDARFSYGRVTTPKGNEPLRGSVDFWMQGDSFLAKAADSDGRSTTLLIRKDGTLVIESPRVGQPNISFYGQIFVPQRLNLPFTWADHPFFGKADVQGSEGRISFLSFAQDPKGDRKLEADTILDGRGRLRNLFWPDKSQPELTLSISGWTELGGKQLPQRIDQDFQQVTESVSVTWALKKELPGELEQSAFTFEGQLNALSEDGRRFIPINDCRVSIDSCVGQTYTPKTMPLLSQIGTAGSKSLKDPATSQGVSPAVFIAVFAGAITSIFAAAWLVLRKKSGKSS